MVNDHRTVSWGTLGNYLVNKVGDSNLKLVGKDFDGVLEEEDLDGVLAQAELTGFLTIEELEGVIDD